MPAYTPVFNLFANAWVAGNFPSGGPADISNIPCQLYINSKADPDMEYGTYWAWSPATFLRIPKASEADGNVSQTLEVPAGSGRYYRKRWVDRIHQGFSNEYIALLLVQCDANGVEVSRDVTP